MSLRRVADQVREWSAIVLQPGPVLDLDEQRTVFETWAGLFDRAASQAEGLHGCAQAEFLPQGGPR
eukprot:15705313-Heterocapsa_arctica.AAC.1